jgi:formylglycine-generating enzyme required for sulfatase activity
MKTWLFTCSLVCILSHISFSQKDVLVEKIPGTDVSFKSIRIEGGSFQAEDGRQIMVSPFYMGTHEVTYDLFVLFEEKSMDTEATNNSEEYSPDAIARPSPPYEDMTWGMGKEGGYPAVSMTQQSALIFCQWLYLKTGRFYRLPTEAEWTYAALKGNQKADPEFAWLSNNSEDKYHLVGSKAPNDLGLYDMYGNVLEWTLDDWQETPYPSEENPWAIPEKRHYRVLKGGSFFDDPEDINPHTRFKSDRKWQQRDPQIPKSLWWLTDGSFVGLRLVSPVDQPSYEEIETFFQNAFK